MDRGDGRAYVYGLVRAEIPPGEMTLRKEVRHDERNGRTRTAARTNYYSAFVGGLIRALRLQSLANEGRV